MDKPKAVVVGVMTALVIIIALGLLYIRGFNIPSDNVVVSSVLGEHSEIVELRGDQSFLTVTDDQESTNRGLKTFEVENIQKELDKLRVRWGTPQQATACSEEFPDPDSYLKIEGGTVDGVVFFCAGVGVDEDGNIVGPYHDLVNLISDLAKEN